MSDPDPTIRPGFEIEHFSDLNPSEREGMVKLVKAGLTGAEARQVLKDPNIGYIRVSTFVGLLKLGLGWREIRDNFREYDYAFGIATDNNGPYRKFSSVGVASRR